eukprot:6212288-Pleurochrysis_carterae.AAC.4
MLPGWVARFSGKLGFRKLPGCRSNVTRINAIALPGHLPPQCYRDISCALPVPSSLEDSPHNPYGID